MRLLKQEGLIIINTRQNISIVKSKFTIDSEQNGLETTAMKLLLSKHFLKQTKKSL